MRIGLVSSVLPDVDLLHLYTLNRQQHLHHSYITHWPSFWITLIGLVALLGWGHRQRWVVVSCLVTICNLLLHLVLDSILMRMWCVCHTWRDVACPLLAKGNVSVQVFRVLVLADVG